MTTIDHRILIPANTQVVWDYISNLSRNPKWQVDCRSVTFLTQKHDGPGTRWRMASESGREYVLEVTAWYKGLGYEYQYVDGANFQENIGRVRLQEIPEGTIVQWTFTYELPGIFSGLRDSLGTRRQIDHLIADSLRKLYLQIKAAGGGTLIEPKSLMRDAPDVEARSHYQPRHPVVTPEKPDGEPFDEPLVPAPEAPSVRPGMFDFDEPPIYDDDAQTLQPIMALNLPPEPPVVEDDTRPNPTAKREPEPAADLPSGDEPDFLDTLAPIVESVRTPPPVSPLSAPSYNFDFDDDLSDDLAGDIGKDLAPDLTAEPAVDPVFDTQPRRASMPPEADPSPKSEQPPEAEQLPAVAPSPASADIRVSDEHPVATVPAPTQPAPLTDVPTVAAASPPSETVSAVPMPLPSTPETVQASEAVLGAPEPEPVPPPTPPAALPAPQVKSPSPLDTANVSIWEIFGVQRPSETQQMKAVVAEKPEPPPSSSRPDMSPVRIGLRTAFRRSRKTIRRIKF